MTSEFINHAVPPMLKRLLNLISPESDVTSDQPLIIPRDQHSISRKNISHAALRIMRQLDAAGFPAFLVGGGVRDLLLGGHPKDFDIATSARPEQIKRLFRGARIIGRRFQIVHVRMGREVIEVTTFRGPHNQTQNPDGMLLRDNVYGTVETDAVRRDFTVNALYYTLKDFALHDYTGGLEDLKQRQLRMIGDPETRYKEDPVRMLRAIRFSAKLGFTIEPDTAQPIPELGPLLRKVPPARLFDEVLKLFMNGSATATFNLLREHQLLEHLFPGTAAVLDKGDHKGLSLIEQTMANTDKRVRSGKPVTPAFIYAALLWLPLQYRYRELAEQMPRRDAFMKAGQDTIGAQLAHTALPKRFMIPMREMWNMQERLMQKHRAAKIVEQPRFRAGYDFLLLREASGVQLDGLGNWWTQYQSANADERERMIAEARQQRPRGNKRRRRSGRSRKPAAPAVND